MRDPHEGHCTLLLLGMGGTVLDGFGEEIGRWRGVSGAVRGGGLCVSRGAVFNRRENAGPAAPLSDSGWSAAGILAIDQPLILTEADAMGHPG